MFEGRASKSNYEIGATGEQELTPDSTLIGFADQLESAVFVRNNFGAVVGSKEDTGRVIDFFQHRSAEHDRDFDFLRIRIGEEGLQTSEDLVDSLHQAVMDREEEIDDLIGFVPYKYVTSTLNTHFALEALAKSSPDRKFVIVLEHIDDLVDNKDMLLKGLRGHHILREMGYPNLILIITSEQDPNSFIDSSTGGIPWNVGIMLDVNNPEDTLYGDQPLQSTPPHSGSTSGELQPIGRL